MSFSLLRLSRPVRLAALLAGSASLADCACGPAIVVVDGFDDDVVDAASGDRLHRYARGASASFVVSGSGVESGVTVTSSDPDVFVVDTATPRTVTGFFAPDQTVLDVIVRSVGAGTADLVVERSDGDVIDARTLEFVPVNEVVLTRVVSLPGELEPPVDHHALAIGPRGADFLIRFADDVDDNVHGLDLFRLIDASMASVKSQTIDGDLRRTERDVLHVAAVAEETHFRYALGALANEDAIVAVPGVVDGGSVLTKNAVRAALAERGLEVPAELDTFFDRSDERVFCDDDTCAAEIIATDAAGRAVFGAEAAWSDGGANAQPGDIVVFDRGDEEHTLHAHVGDFEDTLVVRAAPDSVRVLSSTEAVNCNALGSGGASLATLSLLLLRFGTRRRRR